MGAVLTNASSNIRGYIQKGDEFAYKSAIQVYDSTFSTTPTALDVLVPPIANITARIIVSIGFGGNTRGARVYSPLINGQTPSGTGYNAATPAIPFVTSVNTGDTRMYQDVLTDDGTVIHVVETGTNVASVYTIGWKDLRGKDA